jgi:uncharacterized membrane protein
MGMDWILLITASIALVVLLIALSVNAILGRLDSPDPPNALVDLEGRYARGDIPREEYLRIRAELIKGP